MQRRLCFLALASLLLTTGASKPPARIDRYFGFIAVTGRDPKRFDVRPMTIVTVVFPFCGGYTIQKLVEKEGVGQLAAIIRGRMGPEVNLDSYLSYWPTDEIAEVRLTSDIAGFKRDKHVLVTLQNYSSQYYCPL